jgi:hypothetical protein
VGSLPKRQPYLRSLAADKSNWSLYTFDADYGPGVFEFYSTEEISRLRVQMLIT